LFRKNDSTKHRRKKKTGRIESRRVSATMSGASVSTKKKGPDTKWGEARGEWKGKTREEEVLLKEVFKVT